MDECVVECYFLFYVVGKIFDGVVVFFLEVEGLK